MKSSRWRDKHFVIARRAGNSPVARDPPPSLGGVSSDQACGLHINAHHLTLGRQSTAAHDDCWQSCAIVCRRCDTTGWTVATRWHDLLRMLRVHDLEACRSTSVPRSSEEGFTLRGRPHRGCGSLADISTRSRDGIGVSRSCRGGTARCRGLGTTSVGRTRITNGHVGGRLEPSEPIV
jgi:hypothetical protein